MIAKRNPTVRMELFGCCDLSVTKGDAEVQTLARDMGFTTIAINHSVNSPKQVDKVESA
jgi:hypothetical protein